MDIKIRRFTEEDVFEVSNIIKKAFLPLTSAGYTPEAIAGQISQNSPPKIIAKAKKVNYYVAVNNDKILGFGGFDREKVHTFFVRPEMQRYGIGSKIMEKVLTEAKKDGIKNLKCWSTFNAVNFYSSFGFKKIKILTLPTKNSSITFQVMTKNL